MSNDTWEIVKAHKNFNMRIYRRGLFFLIFSLGLNCILGVMIFYVYLNQPERDYYATSGEAPPIQLKALLAPNYTANALLEPDPIEDNTIKVIPK